MGRSRLRQGLWRAKGEGQDSVPKGCERPALPVMSQASGCRISLSTKLSRPSTVQKRASSSALKVAALCCDIQAVKKTHHLSVGGWVLMGLCLISRRQGGRRILCCLSFVVLSLIGALGLSAPSVRAQQLEIKDLAAKMAESLRASGEKKVAVFDFVGPGETITALGEKLADDFSHALSRSGGHLHVEDRASVAQRLIKMDFEPEDSLDSESVLAFARFLKLNAAVLGTIARDGDQLRISVRAVQVSGKDASDIDSKSATIGLSDESAKLMQNYIAPPETDAGIDKSIPASGQRGYSFPKCVYCPQSQFSQAAVDAKFQGTISLILVVTADGRATNIHPIKRLPFGLTSKAIESVEQWRFEPAKGPDGRPVAVRQIIEVTFHLY